MLTFHITCILSSSMRMEWILYKQKLKRYYFATITVDSTGIQSESPKSKHALTNLLYTIAMTWSARGTGESGSCVHSFMSIRYCHNSLVIEPFEKTPGGRNRVMVIRDHAWTWILQVLLLRIRHANNIPTLEFPEILSKKLIRYHWLSVSGNSKIKHCGILINMPNWV